MLEPNSTQLNSLKRWRLSTTLAVTLGYIGYYLCRGNLSAALPLLASHFKYSNTELAIILSISELVYALGKFINGPLADKYGGRSIFLLGMLGAIFFNVLFVQFQSLLAFTIIWSLCRYCLSMGWGGLIKIVGAWHEPSQYGTVMGWVSISFQLGAGAAFLYCSLILSFGLSWHYLFLIPAATLGLIALITYLACSERPDKIFPQVRYGSVNQEKAKEKQKEKTTPQMPIKDILSHLFSNPFFRWLLTLSFFTTALRSMFTFWVAKFFADLGLESTSAILKAAIFPFLGIAGTLILGWYTDRYARAGNRMPAMIVMLLGLFFSLLGIAFLAPYGLEFQQTIVLLTGACGFFLIGPYSMISGCLTLDIASSDKAGSCTGMLDGMGYVGGALAVWGTGVLSDALGWSEVFYALSFISLLAVLTVFRIHLLHLKSQKKEFLTSVPELKTSEA